jgi:hypothetical protein
MHLDEGDAEELYIGESPLCSYKPDLVSLNGHSVEVFPRLDIGHIDIK